MEADDAKVGSDRPRYIKECRGIISPLLQDQSVRDCTHPLRKEKVRTRGRIGLAVFHAPGFAKSLWIITSCGCPRLRERVVILSCITQIHRLIFQQKDEVDVEISTMPGRIARIMKGMYEYRSRIEMLL